MLLLLLNYVVLRALWKIDVNLISTLVNKSLYYYYNYVPFRSVPFRSVLFVLVNDIDDVYTCVEASFNVDFFLKNYVFVTLQLTGLIVIHPPIQHVISVPRLSGHVTLHFIRLFKSRIIHGCRSMHVTIRVLTCYTQCYNRSCTSHFKHIGMQKQARFVSIFVSAIQINILIFHFVTIAKYVRQVLLGYLMFLF